LLDVLTAFGGVELFAADVHLIGHDDELGCLETAQPGQSLVGQGTAGQGEHLLA
jgi:hypothetical protein